MADRNHFDLPPELLHRIFDYLDLNTILRSLRLVCKQLHGVAITYDRLKLNLTSMSRSDIKCVARSIQFNRIRSITFSESDSRRLNEIDWLLSIFGIQQFSQLKSLNFGQVDVCSKQTLTILSGTVEQDTLPPVRISNLDYLVQQIFRPVQDTLYYLTIHICSYHQYRIILHSSPNLRIIEIGYCDINDHDHIVNSSFDAETHKRLSGLIIHNCSLPIEYLRLFLILTPYLIHLKIVSSRSVYGPVFDGLFWEHLIRIRLPQLKIFEFFFVYPVRNNPLVHSVNSIIATFRTPFWIAENHWLVTCDYLLRSSQITLYTIPIGLTDGEILIRCKASPVDSVCHLISHRTNESGDMVATETPTILDLDGWRIDAQSIRELANVLLHDVTLNTLNLRGAKIGDEQLEQLTFALRRSPTLTTFSLENNQIGALGVQYLAAMLQTNSTLTTLNLRLNQVDDSGAVYLATALEHNTTLNTLDLAGNDFGALGAESLADALKRNTALTTLDLTGNHLGPKGAQHLAVVLLHNTTLSELNLSLNEIWDKGARSIADALPFNTSLRILDLARNDIEESGAQYLANALRNNTRLITLDLSRNHINNATIEMINGILLQNSHMMNLN